MFIRSIDDVPKIEWGQGTSQRILTKKDGMGFAVAHTVVRKGTEAALQYRHHLEACYCIGGRGYVVSADRQTRYEITPGVIYVLDEHDAHYLQGGEDEDHMLVSIFNAPIAAEHSLGLVGGVCSASRPAEGAEREWRWKACASYRARPSWAIFASMISGGVAE